MSLATPKKSSWQKQTAVVISDSPNMHMLLRELLRPYSWTVSESTSSSKIATNLVKMGAANLIIIDDSLKSPAYLNARYLMADPVTLCTPKLSFLLSARDTEEQAILKMGVSSVVFKPLTPAKFVPGFAALIRNWEKEPYVSLRRTNYLYLRGEETKAVMALARLMQVPEVHSICAQAIAMYLRRSQKLKEAEKVLLTSLKRSPRELGTILALADLYLHAAMPKLAHKLLLGARTAFSQSMAMVPDLVQSALMLGQLDDAIQSLNLVLKRGDIDEMTLSFLGRLIYAEGREGEAERVLTTNGGHFKKLHAGWQAADVQGAAAAAGPALPPTVIAS